MQTKQQIRQLLASAGASVNKRLGQHFLIDLNLMRLLVDSAHITNNDIVLEVGCGTGSLTEALADNAGMVIAVECDKALAKIAKSSMLYAGYQILDENRVSSIENRESKVRIINTDILETKSTISQTVTKAINADVQRIADSVHAKRCTLNANRGHIPGPKVLLVANLPYNVASPVILNLVSGPIIADGMYVTVQKEVAQRITAAPGQKHYGVLSIFLSATGDVKTIRVLKPAVFWPRPKVDSVMLGFVRSKTKTGRIKNMELFSNVVHLFMRHRRKMLSACARFTIHDFNWPEIFKQCSIDPTQRPQQLSPENYIAIANLCHRYLCSKQVNRKQGL
jgi:16S rRNA (adenine1518-N6/adenine1519-N6)-dimethyltransferase